MRVSNLKPIRIEPTYPNKITGNFDPRENLKATICPNIRTPIVASTPASILTNAGNPISDDDIIDKLGNCLGENVDIAAEDWCKTLFGLTVANFNKQTTLSMRNIFAIQSGAAANLPEPGPNCMYTEATDVIPVSKKFITGQCDYDEYFATMAFYARVQTLGFYFVNETSFNDFKAYVANCTQALSQAQNFPGDTLNLLGDFQTLKLNGLTESLVVRNDAGDNVHDYSFARVIVNLLFSYTSQVSSGEFGIMPFDLLEFVCPKTLVFVNVEQHMHATPKQVREEWEIIQKSLSMQVRMVSNAKLSKLTATQRAIQNIMHAAVSSANALSKPTRSASARFKKSAPTSVDLTRWIAKLCAKMANVAKSENSYKAVRMTFAKPNRRNPDDFNKQGKSVSTRYRPDIHLYIDCSGSISEKNYQDAVMACIKLAKKMNVNLYFNSFSDSLSQCVKLKTRDKSLKQIYTEFQRIPKVGGGTDYEQIWEYINMSKKRQRELSVVITDFEWYPPNKFVRHPQNLYYAPCSHMDYKTITYWAENFIKTMRPIDPDCRKHVLM